MRSRPEVLCDSGRISTPQVQPEAYLDSKYIVLELATTLGAVVEMLPAPFSLVKPERNAETDTQEIHCNLRPQACQV